MFKTKYFPIFLLIAMLIFSACTQSNDENFSGEPPMPSQPMGENEANLYYDTTTTTDSPVTVNRQADFGATTLLPGEQPAQTRDRIVIKNATLSLVVEDAAQIASNISQLADEMGGWVVSSSVSAYSEDAPIYGEVAIRIPAERLNDAINRIKDQAEEVETETLTGEDVTQAYTDQESRLRNLEAAETQLQLIMEDARRTEDVLSVYNQLVQVRGEIEVIKGQLQYYDEAAAYSSLRVSLRQPAPETAASTDDKWNPGGVVEDALTALEATFQFIAAALIWTAVYLLPIALVFGIPAWILFRITRRRLVNFFKPTNSPGSTSS